MTSSDLWAALRPVVEALERLGVRYYVGGSAASSLHGVPRSSVDADLAAELVAEHARPLFEMLREAYYLDEGRVRDAIASRRSFNAVHLATMFKVDVFVSRGRPFDREVLSRATAEPAGGAFRFATAEDVVLLKLEWFRSGGEVSERQWSDVLGVLRGRAGALDRAYLARWASEIGVADLLERALGEAG